MTPCSPTQLHSGVVPVSKSVSCTCWGHGQVGPPARGWAHEGPGLFGTEACWVSDGLGKGSGNGQEQGVGVGALLCRSPCLGCTEGSAGASLPLGLGHSEPWHRGGGVTWEP